MAVFLISWTESEIEIMSSVIQHSTFHIPIRPGNNGQKEPTWRMATAKLPFPLIQFFMITSIQDKTYFFSCHCVLIHSTVIALGYSWDMF